MTGTERVTPGRKARWVAEGISLLLLTLCLVLLLTNILPVRSQTAELTREGADLKKQIREYDSEREQLDKLAGALESDPYIQEREYKRTFRIYRPGERVLLFSEDEASRSE